MSKYVKLAKRENNSKRGFLIVNPYLGKHVPINPNDVLACFDEVSKLVPENMEAEKTLVIGFAETATALATHYALTNKTLFMQTTRETVPGVTEYIYFSEEHSHATAQTIVKSDLASCRDRINRIIFIDDEITTGNTIVNAVNAIKRDFPGIEKTVKFDVVSILNSMTDEHMQRFKDNNIDAYYLEKLDCSTYNTQADKFNIVDTNYHYLSKKQNLNIRLNMPCTKLHSTRRLVDFNDAKTRAQYETLSNEVLAKDFAFLIKDGMWKAKAEENNVGGNVLVLGTEEFMYPGLIIAENLSQMDGVASVKYHATTRSPIAMSNDEGYPLHHRYELKSFYEADSRRTFIYDLKKYDKVFVVMEWMYCEKANHAGMMSLIRSLGDVGNVDNIYFVGILTDEGDKHENKL